jgi:thiosulfate dehydrogenase
MKSIWFPVALGIVVLLVIVVNLIENSKSRKISNEKFAKYLANEQNDSAWAAPSLYLDDTTMGEQRKMIIYGRDLIAHTSKYFGPNGLLSHNTNGMNCQNCHLDAGTRAWGNNFATVYSSYPQFRARINNVQSIYGRINDCFERSLNGKPVDSNSYEMRSLNTYIKWLGRDVSKKEKPAGTGLGKPAFLNLAADPLKGKIVYTGRCQSCHGDHGQGLLSPTGFEYVYPPLWGEHSYNDGAGMYRLSKFAGFVKNNMPFDQANHRHPALSGEQAWDVAAFVNSQSRPHFDQSKDWSDISKKSFDEPFGPYADSFSEKQHKYGPYPLIA